VSLDSNDPVMLDQAIALIEHTRSLIQKMDRRPDELRAPKPTKAGIRK
jgi:hypothetical protein